MSYVDMPHNFPQILEHLKFGSSELVSLSQFFQVVKNAYANFALELNKASDNFQLQKPESTLTQAMRSLKMYFKQLVSHQLSFINSMQTDIIEPLDLFLEHFQANNSELRERGEDLSKDLKSVQKELIKFKNEYYDQSYYLEKLDRTSVTPSNLNELNTKKKKAKSVIKVSHENYNKCCEDLKMYFDTYETGMPAIMESLQQNEESRIYFIKSSAEKYVRFFQKSLDASISSLNDFSTSLNLVDSKFDIKNFVGGLENPMIIKEEFVDYDVWKQQKKTEDLSDFEIVNSIIDHIVLNKNCKHADFDKLYEILKFPNGKTYFINALEYRKNYEMINLNGLKKLADIFKNLLSSIDEVKESQMLFCKIIALSHVFFSETNSQKTFLSDLLKYEKIWNDEKRWINAIEIAIEAKLLYDKNSPKLNIKKKSGILSTFKDLAQKFPITVKDKALEKSEKSSAYSILSHFTFQMSNLNVSPIIAQEVILELAKNYKLEADRICTLLSQIQLEKNSVKPKKKTTNVTNVLILKQTLPFLNKKELVTLLLLNKSINSSLRPRVTYSLIQHRQGDASAIRRIHWISLLKSHFPPIDYTAMVEKVNNNIGLIGDISEIVDMDVCRSYQNQQEIHQSLKNILKTYAFYNPDVSYCQGMNFIAGTFLLLFNDESLSFKCLIGLVKKFNMDSMFAEGLPRLKCMIYQLDKLIELHLPEVQKFFKTEAISAGHFSSSWFLTLFSSNLQSKIPILLQIWDYFFLKGWKVIFKASITILKLMEEKICNGKFDDIMSLLTGSNLYSESIFNDTFVDKLKQVKISNHLLNRLETDYNEILQLSARVCSS